MKLLVIQFTGYVPIGVVCYEVAEQKVACDPTKPRVCCCTQLTTDIAGMMGLPCSMVNGVPADSVVATCFVLVEMDMVVDYLVVQYMGTRLGMCSISKLLEPSGYCY